MSLEDRLDAAEMLAEEGQAVTLTYPGGGTYDPATGTTSGSAPSPETVSGVILPLSPFRKSQGNIVEGDQQLLLAAENSTGTAISAPVVNGTVTDANSKVWTLIAVDPLNPDGTAILYDCIVRRAP